MSLDTRARRAAQGIHRAVEVREMSLKLEEPRKVERFDRYQDRKQRNRRIGAIVVAAAVVAGIAAIAITSGVLDRNEPIPAGPPDDGVGPVGTVTDIGTLTFTEDGCTVAGLPSGAVTGGDVSLTVVNETEGPVGFDIPKFVPDVISVRPARRVGRGIPEEQRGRRGRLQRSPRWRRRRAVQRERRSDPDPVIHRGSSSQATLPTSASRGSRASACGRTRSTARSRSSSSTLPEERSPAPRVLRRGPGRRGPSRCALGG